MTATFPFAWSEDASAASAARDVGRRLAEQMDAGARSGPPPLGLVYVSDVFAGDMDAILEILKAATGAPAWTGAVGMGVIAGPREVFGAPAIVAMLLDLPAGAAQPFGPIDSAAGFRAVVGQAVDFVGAAGAALGLLHVDPTGDPTGGGVANFPEDLAAAGGLYLVGGLCSGQDAMPAIASGGAAPGAATGAFISLETGVATGVSQGCAPIGPVRAIETAAVGVLARLGDKTALAALLEDLGLPMDANASVLREALAGVHIALPIQGADRRDYVVRNITGVDPERGLIGIADAVEDGALAFYCRRDRESAVRDLTEMAATVRRRLGRPPRGALYVSCLARGPNLFGPNSEEIAIVRAAIGPECPVLGFFANGEIAHDRLYGYTGVLTLFA